jgi:hypothetical protein
MKNSVQLFHFTLERQSNGCNVCGDMVEQVATIYWLIGLPYLHVIGPFS